MNLLRYVLYRLSRLHARLFKSEAQITLENAQRLEEQWHKQHEPH